MLRAPRNSAGPSATIHPGMPACASGSTAAMWYVVGVQPAPAPIVTLGVHVPDTTPPGSVAMVAFWYPASVYQPRAVTVEPSRHSRLGFPLARFAGQPLEVTIRLPSGSSTRALKRNSCQ